MVKTGTEASTYATYISIFLRSSYCGRGRGCSCSRRPKTLSTLGGFVKLPRTKTFHPRGIVKTVTGQIVSPLGDFAKPKTSLTKNVFPLGDFVTRCVILTPVPPFGNLQKKNENRNKRDKGEERGRKNKIKKLISRLHFR